MGLGGGCLSLLVAAATRLGGGLGAVANLLLDADVVVCELAHLGVVDTDNLRFLVGAEAEARDEVHDPEDDGL